MPGKVKADLKKGKKGAPKQIESEKNPLLVARPRNFTIGNDLPPKRDVTRFVRWPKYVTRQRQKRVLERRLKVPPSLNQFRLTLDKSTKAELFKLLAKYSPESPKEKAERLSKAAEAKKADPKAKTPSAPTCLKYGIQQVTRMVEEKKAKMVVIAHDVDPIEIVVWLPALCKAQDIPYCIVKGKAALGKLVGMKTCTAVVVDSVKSEDNAKFSQLKDSLNSGFNNKYDEVKKSWGGLMMGRKGKKTAQ
eukprot:TRINITY_DN1083_c0_g1_i1.p1 TRINITY_DN1083_c0_g1~~TRINITY_DN1083_c0_g1_i1.p1  ORF type:complete len:248 (+),score=78.89 TRINITY_DN1083_c0_g1_i1:55-798(+)